MFENAADPVFVLKLQISVLVQTDEKEGLLKR